MNTDGSSDSCRALEHATGGYFISGNDIDVLRNGEEIFPAMLEAITEARQTIDLATYVYWTGAIADRFAKTLAARAREGVKVRVLLDAFGAKPMALKLREEMAEAGVEVRWFRPLSTWRFWRTDKRMHRKILICDGSLGFTGGVGIADEWEGDARNPDEWRDTHIALRGPLTSALAAAFLDNWYEAGEWSRATPAGDARESRGDISAMVLRSSTSIAWNDIATALRCMIANADSHICITTAYFNPDATLVELLLHAHRRGVKVQLLLPGEHTDSRLSQLAGQPALEPLLQEGVNVWLYQKTMLHAKIMTVDGHLSCVGSANFNHRSLMKDEECCLIIDDVSIAAELDRDFQHDCDGALKVDPASWTTRGAGLRLQEYLARLIQEQL